MTFYLDNVFSCTQALLKLVSGWVPRHVVGAVLVSLPAISVFSHLAGSPQLASSPHLSIQVREKRPGDFSYCCIPFYVLYSSLPLHVSYFIINEIYLEI